MECKICSQPAPFFASAMVLQKHTVSYFRCRSCGFVQTEEPFWIGEAYADAINRSDVGIMERTLQLAATTRSILSTFYAKNGKFIDYGGGHGLFVRLMRDRGFDFYWHDKFCRNIFAQGFEADMSATHPFELLTAFEVMEHLIDPVQEVASMLKLSKSVLFTSLLLPTKTPQPVEWWYYGLDHGQHISFYTKKSLSFLAAKYGLTLYSDGRSLHLLTDKNLSASMIKLLSFMSKLPYQLRMAIGRKTLIHSDYKAITGKDI